MTRSLAALLFLALSFVATSTAVAVLPVTFPAINYSGPITLPGRTTPIGTGSFSLTTSGAFTGSAKVLGRVFTMRGQLNADQTFTATATSTAGRFTLRASVTGKVATDAQGPVVTGTVTFMGMKLPFTLRPPASVTVPPLQ